MVIAPRILARGPPMIRRPFLEAALEAIIRYFIVSGILTLVTGFLLVGGIYGFSNIGTAFQVKGYGIALSIGVAMAVLMILEGIFVITPTARKMLAKMQAMPAPAPGAPPAAPPPEVQAEMAALGKRMAIASMSTVLMGTIALGAMAWAVNTFR
jgi:hypothetical protein